MGIYDIHGNLITNLVDEALSRPDVIEIKNRTLDGKWHIQTIGVGATILWTKAHLTLDEKHIMDDIKATSAELIVIFDGIKYTGIIDGEIGYERIKSSQGPMFTTTFLLLVNKKVVI